MHQVHSRHRRRQPLQLCGPFFPHLQPTTTPGQTRCTAPIQRGATPATCICEATRLSRLASCALARRRVAPAATTDERGELLECEREGVSSAARQ